MFFPVHEEGWSFTIYWRLFHYCHWIKIFNPLGTISSLVNGNGVYFAEGLCLEDLTEDLTHSSCLKIIAIIIIII